MKIGILDYGVGNIRSVYNAVQKVGAEPVLVSNPKELDNFSHVITPGVGHFSYVLGQFRDHGFLEKVQQYIVSGRYYLGICVGMQMLFDKSEESDDMQGLGVIRGDVVKMSDRNPSDYTGIIKLPHIAWAQLEVQQEDALLTDVELGRGFYFVHSYAAQVADKGHQIAYAQYGENEICAMVKKDNVYGTQFHPERSAQGGLTLIKNFCNLT